MKNRRLGGVSELSEGKDLSDYAQLCGRTLARAHARSGDPAAIIGYMGKSEVLDEAIASFAMAYANQTAVDYAALVKAKGPVKAPKPATAKRRRRDRRLILGDNALSVRLPRLFMCRTRSSI